MSLELKDTIEVATPLGNSTRSSDIVTMSLELKDTIEVATPLGNSQIQLFLGDITKLPVEEKVDFIFASALVDNYAALPHTLIGSLKRNLGINVGKLAKHKEMDLRIRFSCWLSAPLDDTLPYKRLVCFEQIASDGIDKQLSRLFRAMMPIFNNQDTSVITPVLATGSQGRPIQQVLPSMVATAVEWIKAGLPLRCLKIVLYAADPSVTSEQDVDCLEIFDTMKRKFIREEKKTPAQKKTYDVCLSYNEGDKTLAETVAKTLQNLDPKLSVHSNTFVFKPGSLWQEHIYQVMTNSERIIPLVTPSYVNDAECLEQFSMALCCNRMKKQECVVPFYLHTCDSLPSYMSLVQYIECRSTDPGDDASVLIKSAVRRVIESLPNSSAPSSSSSPPAPLPPPSPSSSPPPSSSSSSRSPSKTLKTEPKPPSMATGSSLDELPPQKEDTTDIDKEQTGNDEVLPNEDKKYDVFVSYSHQHKEDPKRLVEHLQAINPKLEIFFDVDGLKAGNMWQQTLYNAIDNSHCLVAFLTKGYLSSPVCNEEFNLATARHFTKDSFLLFPIHTGEIDQLPKCFSHTPCVDLRNEKDGLETLAKKLDVMVAQVKATTKIPKIKFVKNIMEQQRVAQFREKFCMEGGNVVRNTVTDSRVKGSIMFLFAQDSLKFAAIMSAIIKNLAPDLVTHLQPFNQLDRTKQLDSSDIAVVFVSDQLACSKSLLHELHAVLCKQRVVKDSTVVYLIECDHSSTEPLYLHPLPYAICMDDSLWKRLERSGGNRNPRPYLVDAPGMQGTYRCKACQKLALTAASHDVLHLLVQRGSGSTIPLNLVNIAQVENEIKGIGNPMVPANENIISLSSMDLIISRWSPECKPSTNRVDATTTKTNNKSDDKGQEMNRVTVTAKVESGSKVSKDENEGQEMNPVTVTAKVESGSKVSKDENEGQEMNRVTAKVEAGLKGSKDENEEQEMNSIPVIVMTNSVSKANANKDDDDDDRGQDMNSVTVSATAQSGPGSESEPRPVNVIGNDDSRNVNNSGGVSGGSSSGGGGGGVVEGGMVINSINHSSRTLVLKGGDEIGDSADDDDDYVGGDNNRVHKDASKTKSAVTRESNQKASKTCTLL